ncbi:M28 family peptidase [Miniphocaeibacter massiliensis]|uniref:M28 family peptidase n=1 Tax=Miniphocaeibacter massiliensis TaxID=2041841 RepID=UPI000C080455|nr:M28 family peptidase [Miniphocaeibacter massiliensis]
MNKNIKDLVDNYQIRKTNKQKISFIAWLRKITDSLGYDLEIDKYNDHGRNLIFGDVEKADIILTAHYDTQPNGIIPRISFMSNPIIYLISEICTYGGILGIFLLFRFALSKFIDTGISYTVTGVLLLLFIFQNITGFANKHTLNDNTSGVATILTIMEDLEIHLRKKVCFVFFDHEELGFLGSKNFKDKYHSKIMDKPLINFDCVSDGNYMFFITKKKFKNSKYNEALNKSIECNFTKKNDKKALVEKASKVIYTSDQILFSNGIAITAMNKAPILGYYLSRIHSSLDRVFDEENIKLLKNTMIDFIRKI